MADGTKCFGSVALDPETTRLHQKQSDFERRLNQNFNLIRSWNQIAQLGVIELSPKHKSLEADFEKLKRQTKELMDDWGIKDQ